MPFQEDYLTKEVHDAKRHDLAVSIFASLEDKGKLQLVLAVIVDKAIYQITSAKKTAF